MEVPEYKRHQKKCRAGNLLCRHVESVHWFASVTSTDCLQNCSRCRKVS
jgi:hypothetical protein